MGGDFFSDRAVLVINCGSSSLKFALLDPATGAREFEGTGERLGTPEAVLRFESGGTKTDIPLPGAGHEEVLREAMRRGATARVPVGIGHRVVHGGEKFTGSVLIDAEVLEAIGECAALAPLHNPANLMGIEVAGRLFPGLPQVAVFDTAFHQTLPRHAFLYAIPYRLYEEQKIRRYGFHGTSHHFVSLEAARLLGRDPAGLNLLTAHLGNGCSACAVRGGRSVDTTMGLTPSEGLVMGTRSGDVDPALAQFLQDKSGMRLAEITRMLNSESGLLGLSGVSNDMRALHEAQAAGNERAEIAIEVFCYRLAKSLLGLAAALDQVDAIVFTGGIGEHASNVRERTMNRLAVLGVRPDPEKNALDGAASGGIVSAVTSAIPCLVVPTNEEWMIAKETARVLDGLAAA